MPVPTLRWVPLTESDVLPPTAGEDGVLPVELADALRQDEYWARWLEGTQSHVGGRSTGGITPPEGAVSETEGLFGAIFRSELLPVSRTWIAYELPPLDGEAASDWRPLMIAPASAQVRVGGDTTRTLLTGRAWRTGGSIGFVLKAEPAPVDACLEVAFPASAINWLPGTLGMGEVTHRPVAGGMEWQHWTPASEGRLSGLLTWIWPMCVRSWSDGAWLAVAVAPAWGEGMERPTMRSIPNFLRPNVPRVSLQRVSELDELFHRRAPVTPVEKLTEDLFRQPDPSARTPGEDLIGPLNAHLRGMKGDWLTLLGQDDWAPGGVAAVPAEVLTYLNVPPDTQTWQVSLAHHPVFGDANAGLMVMARDPQHWTHLVQWVIGPDKLALTIADRQGLVWYENPMMDPSADGGATTGQHAARDVPLFCGEYGWRLALAPMDIETNVNGEGVVLTPKPDTPFGLLGEERVGDQPWAKCRIYIDEAVEHFVFDLPKEG